MPFDGGRASSKRTARRRLERPARLRWNGFRARALAEAIACHVEAATDAGEDGGVEDGTAAEPAVLAVGTEAEGTEAAAAAAEEAEEVEALEAVVVAKAVRRSTNGFGLEVPIWILVGPKRSAAGHCRCMAATMRCAGLEQWVVMVLIVLRSPRDGSARRGLFGSSQVDVCGVLQCFTPSPDPPPSDQPWLGFGSQVDPPPPPHPVRHHGRKLPAAAAVTLVAPAACDGPAHDNAPAQLPAAGAAIQSHAIACADVPS